MQEIEQELTEENLLAEFDGLLSENKIDAAWEMLKFVRGMGYSENLIEEMERVYSEAMNYETN